MKGIAFNKMNNLIKRTKDRKGFTLVELIVSMVVLSILLTVSVMGLMAWQDWSEFNKMNEYAETMYLAAQNQLSEYSANGTLEDFSNRVYQDGKRGNIVLLDNIYYESDKHFTSEFGQEGSVWQNVKPGTLVYLTCQEGDYNRYKAGADTLSDTAPFVFELLEAYVYDTGLLNGTICIEYSLEEGQVFSALYTDRASVNSTGERFEEFVYDNDCENVRGTVNIATRYESYRKERMVGYYGVDTLSMSISGKKQKPAIAKLMLNNEETLNLSFKVSKIPNATTQMNYDITIYDADSDVSANGKPVLKFTLNGAMKNYLNREEQMCDFTRFVYDESTNSWVEQELGKMPVLAWIEADNTIRVVLDAADIQATSNLYMDSLQDLKSHAADSPIKASDFKLKNTYSFHRFGLDADNIYCEVKGYGAMYKATSKKRSNTSHAYFKSSNDNVTAGVTNYNYMIANARHLYNMRYATDLSLDELKISNTKMSDALDISMHFWLTDNIDWTQFVADGYYFDTESAGIMVDDEHKDMFASFMQLRMKDTFDGNDDYVISGLKISEANNALLSIYGTGDLTNVDKPVGLFVRNFGTIRNTSLDKIQVTSASDKVGAFCGVNVTGVDGYGILNNLYVLDSAKNSAEASIILGKEHVGGVMGYLQGVEGGAGAQTTYSFANLNNAAKVSGNKFVGGIVGEIRIPKKQMVSVSIENCTNTGAIIARVDNISASEKNKIRYIGGITGYCANMYEGNDGSKNVGLLRIVNCNSSPEYSELDLQAMLDTSVDNTANVLSAKLNGLYVGGIVGYNYYSTIESCNTEIERGKVGYVFGDKYVGGICGFNRGPASGIRGGNASARGINGANVVGNKYVGGITGCNADVDDEQILKSARTAVINDETVPDAQNRSNLQKILSKSDAAITSTEIQELLEILNIDVVPLRDRNPSVILEQWVNKGIVFATNSYAGGISGYNTGWIYNCDSKVDNSHTTNFFQYTYSGDYAGGIAGYNNGIIGNTKRDSNDNYRVSNSENRSLEERRISAICYVTGKNYVGGIVGYNDENAIVEDYAISSGYIRGSDESFFVGGYAGLNASVLLLQDENGNARYIESNPNEVKGRYFVGGSIGGNIINTRNYVDNTPDNPTPDEPGEDPITPPVVGDCYAKIEVQNGKLPQTPGDGIWRIAYEIYIYNQTGDVVDNWSIQLPSNIKLGNSFWNISCNNNIITSAQAYNKTLNNGESDVGGFYLETDEETVKLLLNTTWPVTYGANKQNNLSGSYYEMNSKNELLGASGDFDVCPIEMDRRDGWGSENSWSSNYNFYVTNTMDSKCTSWEARIEVPEGTVVRGNWNCTMTVEGNILIIRSDNQSGPLDSGALSKNVGGQLEFKTPEDYTYLLNSSPLKFYFDGELKYTRDDSNPVGPDPTDPVDPDPTDPVDSELLDIYTQFKTSNFLGQLTGKAFVGGFVGYNLFVDNDNNDYSNGYVYALQDALIKDFAANEGNLKKQYMELEDIENASLNSINKINHSNTILHIEGDDAQEKTNSLGVISADICVAGVVGYNDLFTRLEIKNVVNATPIVANISILNENEQPDRTTNYRGDDITYKYSYAGGIIGKVGRYTVIDSCKNSISGIVSTKGTYNGSLCEINEGLIKNCLVSVTGFGIAEYVAGLSGLNKTTGQIMNCSIVGISVNGRNVVGGLAAENFGLIDNPIVKEAKLTVTGKKVASDDESSVDGLAGSIAAFNASTGVIVLKTNIENITIESKGDHVGGIIGINEGYIRNQSETNNIEITGNIIGRQNVGGLIGTNASAFVVGADTDYVSHYVNRATITSLNGNAGGIIGNNLSNNVISGCENYGVVTATENGNAGGIVAENASRISNCSNYGSVMAPNGMCAGITSVNKYNAYISNCQVLPIEEEDQLVFSSRIDAGGICAVNHGTVEWCKAKNISVYNYIDSDSSNIGVMVGVNTGTILLAPSMSNSVLNCSAKTYTNYSNVGGVAGLNQGLIQGAELSTADPSIPQTIVSCEIGFASLSADEILSGESSATIANLGGIAGNNEGIIERCAFNGKILGDLGDENTGYGGIAGVSGENMTRSPSRIEECSFDGYLHANGSSNNVAAIGGIVGRNKSNSTVQKCWIGVLTGEPSEEMITVISAGDISISPYDTSSNANIGGIVGENSGSVLACDNNKYSKDMVNIISFAGSDGGIVGLNNVDAIVTGLSEEEPLTTSSRWNIEARYMDNDNGDGGVIGKSFSGANMSYVSNYAYVANIMPKVSGNNSTVGGVVGRVENQYGTNSRFYMVYNHGDILGHTTAGGIVSSYKYQGVTFENCENTGNIFGTPDAAGGICAKRMASEAGMYFRNCKNHGNLTAKTYCGGILGNSADKNSKFVFYNCVNTGIIGLNNNTSGGIVGRPLINGDGAYFINCRNYGSGVKYGISGTTNNPVYMRNCLDLGGNTGYASNFGPMVARAQQTTYSYNNFYINTNSGKTTNVTYTWPIGHGQILYVSHDNATDRNLISTSHDFVNDKVMDLYNNPSVSTYYNDKKTYSESFNANVRSSRIPTYLEVDQKYMEFLYANYDLNEKLNAPSSITLSVGDANYQIKWTEVTNAADYELAYTLVEKDGTTEVKDADGNPVMHMAPTLVGLNSYITDLDNEWYDKQYKIKVTVRAISGYHMLHMNDEGITDAELCIYDSPEKTQVFDLYKVLPTPKLHAELVAEDAYVLVLDNREDYKTEDGYLDCVVEASGDPFSGLKINVKDSDVSTASKNITVVFTGNNNKTSQYVVKPNSSISQVYAKSTVSTVVVSYLGANNMKTTENNKCYSVGFDGFSGSTNDSMSYKVRYYDVNKGQSTGVVYVASDIMAYDEELGLDVSYGHGLAKATFAGEAYSILDNLPSDFVGKDKITVVTYPWKNQADIVYYGHVVYENINLMKFEGADADLETKEIDGITYYNPTKIKDPLSFVKQGTTYVRTNNSICDSNGLKKGYLIYKNSDGTYNIIYNACLALETNGKFYQVVRTTYELSDTVDADNYMYYKASRSGVRNYRIQPKPVIDENSLMILSDLGTGATTYSFCWDQNTSGDARYENAIYNVELVGVTIEGKKVSLANKSGVADKKVAFEDKNSAWNYPAYELQVVRVGEVDEVTGNTLKLPQKETKVIKVKVRFDSIPAPQVQLAKVGDVFDKDHLNYVVTWSAIEDAHEQSDLGGYLIEARTENVDGVTQHVHYYYVTDALDENAEININIPELSSSGPVTCVSLMTSDEDASKGLRSTEIDVSDFVSGTQVNISVRAIAKKGASNYKDGLSDGSYPLIIPARLTTKSASILQATPEYDADAFLSVKDINDLGIELSLNDANETGNDGQYQIAVAIYDDNGKTLQDVDSIAQENSTKIVEKLGDAPSADAAGYWNSGAIKTVINKKDVKAMDGNDLSSATYTLKKLAGFDLSDYAGMWLKVAIRSVSETMISSTWSDEDLESNYTVNYKWIQIPAVQIDSIGLIGTETKSYDSVRQYYAYDGWTTDMPEAVDFVVDNRALILYPQKYADCYKLQLVDQQEKAHSVYIEPVEGAVDSYNVYYVGPNANDNTATSTCKLDSYAVFCGLLDDANKEVELPYSFDFILDAETYTISAKLIFKDNKIYVSLPDVVEYSMDETTMVSAENQFDFTNYVSMQALVNEEDENRYVASEIGSWYRDADKEIVEKANVITDSVEFASIISSTQEDDQDVTVSILSTDGHDLLAQICVLDTINDGKLVLSSYHFVPVELVSEQNGTYSGTLSLDKGTYFAPDTKVIVRFAGMTGRGLTQWSKAYVLTGNGVAIELQ